MTLPIEELKEFRDKLAATVQFSGDVEYGLIYAVLKPLNKYVEEIERVQALLDSRTTRKREEHACCGVG